MLYKTLSELQDGRDCAIDFTDDYSLPGDFVVKGAKVTFIANPNSPSGTMISPRKLSEIAAKIDGVLVIDEAYADFAHDNCLRLVESITMSSSCAPYQNPIRWPAYASAFASRRSHSLQA